VSQARSRRGATTRVLAGQAELSSVARCAGIDISERGHRGLLRVAGAARRRTESPVTKAVRRPPDPRLARSLGRGCRHCGSDGASGDCWNPFRCLLDDAACRLALVNAVMWPAAGSSTGPRAAVPDRGVEGRSTSCLTYTSARPIGQSTHVRLLTGGSPPRSPTLGRAPGYRRSRRIPNHPEGPHFVLVGSP